MISIVLQCIDYDKHSFAMHWIALLMMNLVVQYIGIALLMISLVVQFIDCG